MITVVHYTQSMRDLWNAFEERACNSTLLHHRSYMDYHSNRFVDASLVFFDGRNKPVALFPACLSRRNAYTVVSHEGLTYGGLVIQPHTHTYILYDIYMSLINYYKNEKLAKELIIKPIPFIYSTLPCQEELYIIHLLKGVLAERHLSQAIDLRQTVSTSKLRRRCILKAKRMNIETREATTREEWDIFHKILSDVLKARHNTHPVHTSEELWLLHSRFSQKIKLYTAFSHSTVLAGCVIYISKNVVHTQYLASTPEGFETGALDLVIDNIIHTSMSEGYPYVDFGVSTERTGELNYGLTLQKEGFGGCGVCYDSYLIKL